MTAGMVLGVCQLLAEDRPASLLPIGINAEGRHFVRQGSAERWIVRGVNYDHDGQGRLLEDYWIDEWSTVVEDFREMKALGVNTVRIHLQLGRFMTGPTTTNRTSLEQLRKLVGLAESERLYLDLTGLGCYHKKEIPVWYDPLPEADRWAVQQHFWKAVAEVCKGSPAIFCYDLMNEPILPGDKEETEWLAGELGGKFFVQRISLSLKGRTREAVAKGWVEGLARAIRSVDDRTPITVGVIPWAQVFPGAKPLFYSPEVSTSLDFVSIHLYPRAGKKTEDLAALRTYQIGKPLVVEEIFPLNASVEETATFIRERTNEVDGWVSFYWGQTIHDYKSKTDVTSGLIRSWLGTWATLMQSFSQSSNS